MRSVGESIFSKRFAIFSPLVEVDGPLFYAMSASESLTKHLNVASPDGGWLQSNTWRAFQGTVGHRTFHFESDDAWANVIEYTLPIVGKYWYVPRGPIQFSGIRNQESGIGIVWEKIEQEARTEEVGWIRFDPMDEALLQVLSIEQGNDSLVRKAPHDMQPREILVIDSSQSDTALLSDMKPKTRYNIRLAEKRGVRVLPTHEKRYQDAFLDMIDRTAARKGIDFHPRSYYEAFFRSVPEEYWELLIAERLGVLLAANLVVFFGDTATYLYGASGDDGRENMAPHLLQWEGMRRARERGCGRYDFGGVDTIGSRASLSGVTRFKKGFSSSVKAIQFPGSYDRILKRSHYQLYRSIQMSKNFVIKAKRHLTKK